MSRGENIQCKKVCIWVQYLAGLPPGSHFRCEYTLYLMEWLSNTALEPLGDPETGEW